MKFIEQAHDRLESMDSLSRLWKLIARIAAVGFPLFMLIKSLALWNGLGDGDQPVKMTVNILLMQLVFVGMGAWSFAVFWTRANDQLGKPGCIKFPLVHLAGPGFKAIGEMFAGWFALMGLGGFLCLWLTQYRPGVLDFFIFGSNLFSTPFLMGLSVLICGCVAALLCIFMSYLAAEGSYFVIATDKNASDMASTSSTSGTGS